MFYKQIPKKEIPKDIQQYYTYMVKPYKGQLVIVDHVVVKLVDLIRDDGFDGEWCLRFLHFPSATPPQVTDQSIIACHVVPLKGIIRKIDYRKLVKSWKMNEPYYPYSRDYSKEY
jgi:hypothetical protein